MQKVQRIEDHIMQKEMYNYQKIQEQILNEKKAAAKLKAKTERELRETREKEYLGAGASTSTLKPKTGDPFKDFDQDL